MLDPQGKVIKQTLKNMGHNNIEDIRQGKYFEIELKEDDKTKAERIIEEISQKLLSNSIIEDYTINYK